MNIRPAHIAMIGAGATALGVGSTLGVGSYQRSHEQSPAILLLEAAALTAMTGGIIFGSRAAETDVLRGAAIFAGGLGFAMGHVMTLPIALAPRTTA